MFSYLQQNLPEFNYLKHLVLMYGDSRSPWTQEQLGYYVAHHGEDDKPDGWLFDSFLFINAKSSAGHHYVADINLGTSMSGEGDFFSACSPTPGDKKDWEELLEFYFGEGGALDSLDRTIQEIAGLLRGMPTRKRNVVLTLPYPHITQEHFGVVEEAAGDLNFSTKGHDLAHATGARLTAAKWFVDQIWARWQKAGYRNLNLLGIYWIYETVYRSWSMDDHVLLKELRKHVNAKGLKLVWIPFYATYNFHLLDNYRDYYFDMAFLQPNFLFYKEGKTIDVAAGVARRTGAGLEIEYYLELDEPIAVSKERHLRFREYLNAGVKYGYMKEAACAHFQGVNSLQRMIHHKDPAEREFYEDICKFVWGTYQVKPYPPVSVDSYFVPKKKAAIAIDLGGTSLRMGVVDEAGMIVHWKEVPTPDSREAIAASIVDLAQGGATVASASGYTMLGIGVSSAGRVDNQRGIIVGSTGLLPGWEDVAIRSMLKSVSSVPVVMENDGNCSAVAERWFGKGRGIDDFVSVVLGTGIGGGIYSRGVLVCGRANSATEIGHLCIDVGGPMCTCGGRGCVELYASGSGIARLASERKLFGAMHGDHRDASAKAVGEYARTGNPDAVNLLNEAGTKLGMALTSLVNIFDPSRIILSGSLVALGDRFFDPMRDAVMQYAVRYNQAPVEIVFSDFHREIGIIGAAALVFERVLRENAVGNTSSAKG